jgi:PIN domain nuclease of toxin-antitoxin system
MNYCLDSWAVIALIENEEPVATIVERLLEHRPYISTVNATEVFYVTNRRSGIDAANEVMTILRAKTRIVPVDLNIATSAGLIKSNHKMSLGDCFCVATALQYSATILTGDPEILDVKGKWKVRDLRQK